MTFGAAACAALLSMGLPAHAAPIVCDIDAPNAKNYMEIDDSQVSSCIDAGKGTLSGNNAGGNPDEFLSSAAGAGYETVSKSDGTNPFNITYDQGEGTWSFDASAWDLFAPSGTNLVLGFKWGTGNTFDEYFLFQLVSGVSSGDFLWFPLAVKGGGTGGLSHMNLYASEGDVGDDDDDDTDVPEPGSLALLGLGLMGLGLARRRKTA
jgi:hypothetical protein